MRQWSMGMVLVLVLAWLPASAAAAAKPGSGSAPARTGKKASLAVFDFTLAGKVAPQNARMLADIATTEATRTGLYRVISQADVASLLGLEGQRQLLGCDDASCVAQIAGALDADRLLSGSVALVGHTTVVNVRLVDVKRSLTLAHESADFDAPQESDLIDAVRRMTFQVLTGKALDTTGTVLLDVSQKSATVLFDGQVWGSTPLRGSRRARAGPHEIVVQKEGFVRWSSTVDVPAGGEVPLEVTLVPLSTLSPARSRLWTWGWISTGVAIAGFAATTVFGLRANRAFASYQAATDRSSALAGHSATASAALNANVSFGIAGAATVGAGALLISALISDAGASSGR